MPAELAFAPGKYRASITSWMLSHSNEKKTPCIIFTFSLLGMYDDGAEELVSCPQFGRSIYCYLTEKTIDWVVGDLAQLGYDREGFDDLDPASDNAFDFAGVEFDAICEHDVYEGKKKERWKFGFGGPQAEPLERKEVSRLNAMFGAKLKARVAASRPAPAPTPQPSSRPGKPVQPPAARSLDRQAAEVF